MKDHENRLVSELHARHRELLDENRRLQDAAFQKASTPDKIHAYLTMLAVILLIFSPIFLISTLAEHFFKK